MRTLCHSRLSRAASWQVSMFSLHDTCAGSQLTFSSCYADVCADCSLCGRTWTCGAQTCGDMRACGHTDMRRTGRKRSAPAHADEQGLGKTVQALALIVSEPPTLEDAAGALAAAEREQSSAALHPESREARAARAAGAGVYMPGEVDEPGVLLLLDPALIRQVCLLPQSQCLQLTLRQRERGCIACWTLAEH